MKKQIAKYIKKWSIGSTLYAYGIHGDDAENNWTNGDYQIFSDESLGDDYLYDIRIYVPTTETINGEIAIAWLEAGTSREKAPSYFEYYHDLSDKKRALQREEAKLLLLGFPFEYGYEFDTGWKRQLNKENRRIWGLDNEKESQRTGE